MNMCVRAHIRYMQYTDMHIHGHVQLCIRMCEQSIWRHLMHACLEGSEGGAEICIGALSDCSSVFLSG